MAISAIEQLAPVTYVPVAEKDSDTPTSFTLKALNGLEYLEVFREFKEDDNKRVGLTGHGLKLTLRYGLVGWENFIDQSGKQIPFTADNKTLIPFDVISELSNKILLISQVRGEQLKNS